MTASALIAAVNKAIGVSVVAAAATLDADASEIEVSPPTIDQRSRFEIGSVTKTMTATMLALLVGEGKLALDDPIGRWLDAGECAAVTVEQLATHTSGLPSMSPKMRERAARNPGNPWAGSDFAQAEQDLRDLRPQGNAWAYSNLGYQLLGLIVERASGLPYAQLLAVRLFEPLGMVDSRVGHSGDGLLLQGRNRAGLVGQCDHPFGAGGVEATIADLARYARACLVPPPTPLGEAIKQAQVPRVRTGPETEQALGWLVRRRALREHSGATTGFTGCLSISPGRGGAVALLAAYGGGVALASHLKNAALRELAGEDPSAAEQPRPFPGWREAVDEVVRLLLAGEFRRVHERFAPARRESMDPERLALAWRNATADAGDVAPAGGIRILREEVAATGAIVADVAIAFSVRPRRLRVGVLPDGAIGGLALIPVGPAD